MQLGSVNAQPDETGLGVVIDGQSPACRVALPRYRIGIPLGVIDRQSPQGPECAWRRKT